MNVPMGELDAGQFLEQYWQKKPCLIRQALPDFDPDFDGNDLAGLACEEMVESRLVTGSYTEANWALRHGPFSESDFSKLPESDWTLLVQDVEKHYQPLQELLQRFSFIPDWRLDDLMISYAVKGGSVGPHTDQYDVFLLQVEGRRRWQIARNFENELLAECPLSVLRSFTAEQDWVLEPGDLLYLPPGIAHHGVALEPGMTWSVGARAPSGADLLQGLGEWLAFRPDEGGRYPDPGLQPVSRAGEIDAMALEGLCDLMGSQLGDTSNMGQFLAAFMSRFRLAHEPAAPPEPVTPEMVKVALNTGTHLLQNPWTRLVWVEQCDRAHLYAAGQPHVCDVHLAEALCRPGGVKLDEQRLDGPCIETITALINEGHLLLA